VVKFVRYEDMSIAAATPEPPPVYGGKVVLDYVLEDLRARAEMGKRKYGNYLTTDNGRDALMDAYQEQLDSIMYTRQLILEREEELELSGELSIERGKVAKLLEAASAILDTFYYSEGCNCIECRVLRDLEILVLDLKEGDTE